MITQTLPRAATHPLPGWGLWAAWIIATVYGGVASLVMLYTIQIPTSSETIGAIPQVVLIAIIMSLAQWPVLYRYLPALSPRQWLGANVLGYSAGFFIGWASDVTADLILQATIMPNWDTHTIRDPLTLAVGGAGAGAVLALAQWLALRPYLRGAGRWIYAGAAAWAWAGAAAPIMQNTLWPTPIFTPAQYLKTNPTLVETLSRASGLEQIIVFAVLLGLACVLLIGAITGLALAALVRAHARETP